VNNDAEKIRCEFFQMPMRRMMTPQQPRAAGADETLLAERRNANLAQCRVPRQAEIIVRREINPARQRECALPFRSFQPLQRGGYAGNAVAQFAPGTERGPNSTD
jgi:hypothetical protein